MSQLLDAFLVEPRWFTIIGLTLDAVGAVVIAAGVFVNRSGIDSLIQDAGIYRGEDGEISSPALRERIRQ